VRLLVTGAGGMLGRELVVLGAAVTAADRHTLDITDAGAVTEAVAGQDVVVNAAAWTDVDGAESHEAEATAINGDGAANLAAACAKHGATLIHVSTDYVFSGAATGPEAPSAAKPGGNRGPWAEDEPTAPINAYGRGKLAGEQAVLRLLPTHGFVVRTAWLYGEHGTNFVRTILRLAQTRDTLDVVDDQHGQPTWARELARQLLSLAAAAHAGKAPAGIYHGTASGQTTWFGLARAAFEETGLDPDRVRPVSSDAFPRPARRPAYSVLGHDRWALSGVDIQPPWREQLRAALSAGLAP
jgi:dTDP-4-dehydrorhamnose reductase